MKLRPRYKIEVDNIDTTEARKILKQNIENEKIDFEIQSNEFYIHIYMPLEGRKLWTPYMAITFEDTESGVIIRAHVGPSGKIWLPFAFLYSAIFTAILFVAIYGLTQLSLNHNADILYSLIPISLMMGGMYLMSYLGQKKSSSCIIVFDRILSMSFRQHPFLTNFGHK